MKSLALPSDELGDHNAPLACYPDHGAGDIQLVVHVLVVASLNPDELHASRMHLLPLALKTLMLNQVQSFCFDHIFLNLIADPGL